MSHWITLDCNGQPHCRHENGFAEYQGQFYLFGGRRIQPVDVFNPATRTWASDSAPPIEIHHFQPVIVGTEIWLLGTMTGEFPRETPLESVMIYEPESDRWKEGPTIPKARRRGA
ncbi:MAG: kelch repeat-containing protein, partial [Pseudomonadota bacterium]